MVSFSERGHTLASSIATQGLCIRSLVHDDLWYPACITIQSFPSTQLHLQSLCQPVSSFSNTSLWCDTLGLFLRYCQEVTSTQIEHGEIRTQVSWSECKRSKHSTFDHDICNENNNGQQYSDYSQFRKDDFTVFKWHSLKRHQEKLTRKLNT